MVEYSTESSYYTCTIIIIWSAYGILLYFLHLLVRQPMPVWAKLEYEFVVKNTSLINYTGTAFTA